MEIGKIIGKCGNMQIFGRIKPFRQKKQSESALKLKPFLDATSACLAANPLAHEGARGQQQPFVSNFCLKTGMAAAHTSFHTVAISGGPGAFKVGRADKRRVLGLTLASIKAGGIGSW